MRMMSWVNLLSPDGQVNRWLTTIAGWFSIDFIPPDWLAGSHLVVILGLVYGYIPFFILPLFAALDRIDEATLEASRDLGAKQCTDLLAGHLAPVSERGARWPGDHHAPDVRRLLHARTLLSGSPRTRMYGNTIDQFINQTTSGGALGAALTIILMIFVAGLMIYYLRSINRASQEARE